MATVTRTYVENASSSYKSTWTVSTTKADVIVNGSSFTLSLPTCTAKYVYSGKNNAYVGIDGMLTFESEYPFSIRSDWSYVYYSSLASGTTVTLPTSNVIINTITTSSIWTSSNKTTRSIPVYCKYNLITLQSEYIDSGGTGSKENSITTRTDPVFMICNAILDAPPLVTLGTPTYSEPQWAGLGTYSVPITQASAQYGGDISSITLSVGSDSVTQTYSSATISDQTVSLIPSIAGTYTPTITVTDSRGQVTTTNLPQITVYSYTAPSINFDLARCSSSGVPQAEGEHGLVTANISYVDAIAELTQPTVSVKDEGDNTIISSTTWYTTWDATNGVSNAVNWTNYNPTSPVSLYGVISATGSSFSPNESYTVSITPTDNMGGVASTITQTLATGFFTIDFQAGGKEIAFGAPANDDLTLHPNGLFKCDMDAWFNGDVHIQGGGSGTSTPTADTTAQWDSDTHMNSEDMTSQEVEDFVDGLNVTGGVRKWTAFPTTRTGTGTIDISSIAGTWEELCVEVFINGGDNREFFFVPRPPLADGTYLYMRQGGYGTSMASQSCYVTIGVQPSIVSLNDAMIFGTNYNSTSIMRIWYR